MSEPEAAYSLAMLRKAVADERERIVLELAAIHWPEYDAISLLTWCCCSGALDADGDCPTMRIVKGKPDD